MSRPASAKSWLHKFDVILSVRYKYPMEQGENTSASRAFYAAIAFAIGAPLVVGISAHFSEKNSACDPGRPEKTIERTMAKPDCGKQSPPSLK